jgi:hypothetical protein
MLSVPTGTQCVEHMDRKKPAWDPEEGAGKPKKGKSPAKPRKNSEARRLVQHFLFDFSITPVRLRDSGDATRSRGPDKFPRVWMRSIRGCGKVVKKNSYSDHKILWSACRKRLSVVVRAQTYATGSSAISGAPPRARRGFATESWEPAIGTNIYGRRECNYRNSHRIPIATASQMKR